MILLKLFLGVVFFFLGWIYFYRPNLVLELNRRAREVVFNDKRILLERKKLAILFFCLSFIALYMGFTSFAARMQDGGRTGAPRVTSARQAAR